MQQDDGRFLLAVDDFHRARRRATLEKILARLTGDSADLLSFEEVRRKLRSEGMVSRGLQEIPLDAIVGSVGRYDDFTRGFLPLANTNEQRWAQVEVAATGMTGLPPIEVYQIGTAYFVKEGNHRVSVARSLDATHIQAYVTEVRTKVPLEADVRPDDLIVKAEYAGFLDQTKLDKLRPGADLSMSVPGQYEVLREHIDVHRYFMGLEQEREIPYGEAVAHWYDVVYLPVARVIREQSALREFPGRTEADLYLWVSEHRAELQADLGWEIETGEAAADLVGRSSPRLPRIVARLGEKVLDAVLPDEFEAGPPPGEWRREFVEARREGTLFDHILVPIGGGEDGWRALDQALVVAQREGSVLRGLHVVSSEARRDEAKAQALKAEFGRRCQAAGISGELALEVGGVARRACRRARWTDLVVLSVAHPPAPQPLARFGSGFRAIVYRCATPILAVRGVVSPLSRALLAYDGSTKADEALFVATYLSGRWHVPLVVMTVLGDAPSAEETLSRARSYLDEHGVAGEFIVEKGSVAEAILRTAEAHGVDLLIMGGYGFGPLLQIALGSTVDQVLRAGELPVLICR